MKRLLAFLMILSLMLCAVGCHSSQGAFTKAEAAAKYGVEESVIDEYHNKYPKSTYLPTKDENFAEDHVIVTFYPFANTHTFTPDDFPELQCTTVRTLIKPYQDSKYPIGMLRIDLENPSKEAVIEAIRLLQLRADIFNASVDYIFSVNDC